MMGLDQESRKNIADMERQSGQPSGIGRINRGECPIHAVNTMACMFCPWGHMLHCHYPFTCEEADCGHYEEEG